MTIHLEVFNKNISDKRRKLVDEPVNQDLIGKNKFANNSEYVPDSVYRRILNKLTNYQWSFIPHHYEDKGDYVVYIGLLVVPGFGVHTGIGSAKKNKKDSSNTLSAAKTYAFKNACKEMGLAPNVDDKDELYDEDLFEHIDEDEIDEDDTFDLTEEEEKSANKEKPKRKEPQNKKEKKTKKKPPKATSIKDRIEEVRQAYELEDDEDFVAFIQVWDEDILELDDMDDEDWNDFLDYLEKNKQKFEDF